MLRRCAPVVCVLAMLAVPCAPPSAQAWGLSQTEHTIADAVALDDAWSVAFLESLIRMNSGSRNTAGIQEVSEVCAAELAALGFITGSVRGDIIRKATCPTAPNAEIQTARHLVARRVGNTGKRVLLSAHLDTVFEPDSGFLTVTRDGDRLLGPGVVDCKGGVAVMFTALRALHAVGALDDATITVVLNSDEELGSLTSRRLLETEALEHDAAVVFEGALEQEGGTTITTQRKGLGQFRIVVEGRAAHAGANHPKGANALEELAGHILAVQALTDYDEGTTLNVGTVGCPGCKRNIVPGCAQAEVDVRYTNVEAGRRVEAFFAELGSTPRVRAAADGTPTRTRTEGVLHRPVWHLSPESVGLRDLVFRIADALGLAVVPRHSGGGSDANLIAAVGCPVIDGLGPVGGGIHTHNEWVDIPSLTARAQLTALTIYRLLLHEQPAGTLAPAPEPAMVPAES